jgi:hypothetical protein
MKSSSALDITFLVYASLGTIVSLVISLFFWFYTLINLFSEDNIVLDAAILNALGFSLLAICGIPAIYTGARAVLRKDVRRLSAPTPFGYLPIFLFPVALILGYLAYARNTLTFLLAPIAQLVAAIAAVTFSIQVARQHGALLTRRRFWAQFVTGLWLVPLLALLMEMIALIPIILMFGLGAMTSETGQELLKLLSDPNIPSISTLGDSFERIVFEPWFIAIILSYFSILVPLIEEFLKTIVVWPWLFRRSSSAEALMGGIIGGSGYALFEAVFISQQGDSWMAIMIGRAGATMMHAFTTGIASWGFAEGFVKKRWVRAITAFLVAVGFHGLWNASAMAIAFSATAIGENNNIPWFIDLLHSGGPIYIVFLSIIAVFGLPWITRRIKPQPAESSSSSGLDDTGPIVARDPRRM